MACTGRPTYKENLTVTLAVIVSGQDLLLDIVGLLRRTPVGGVGVSWVLIENETRRGEPVVNRKNKKARSG
jgi:hypothetical protein